MMSIPSIEFPTSQQLARSTTAGGMVSSLARAAFAILLLLGPWQRAGAAEFVVGDVAFGWDSGINYAAWARGRAFAVGDVLVFEYVSSQHNVYEVSESTYRSCDTGGGSGGGVRVRYTSGYDRVVLADPRTYWFICDFPGHCLGGMKLAVNVSAAGTLSPNGTSNAASPNGSGNAAASPAGGGRRRSWLAWGLALGVVVSMM